MHALFLVLLCATSFQAVRKAPPSFRSSQCIMGSPGRWILWTVCACLAARQKAALRVTMREASLEVVRGDSVLLPCSFFTSSDFSRLNVIWTLAPFSSPETPVQVIVYDHRQVIKNPSLIGRVDFTGLPSRADIMLNDTHVSDGGIYRCMVNNPPDTADPGVGELLLSVLEPPSLPVCEWDGDVDVGGSVRLSCSVEEGVPTPEIRWEKVDPEEISLPINMDGELSGSVQIVNVSSQTSGLYRCSAANALGTQNCYVKLAVYRTADGAWGVLPGVLLTLVMSLVLLALLALVVWLHRTGQDGRSGRRRRRRRSRGHGKAEEEECYNEIRYTPSLMKRSFV
ncbi:immunoglobulin superfamily member 11 isoform X5 [Fundulus heteroclitus]|uniref:immunoglobulin superfamily member 11 isoform X5 n=1 Tax=Fundulus heteroclitus TaxID=8078 RepID=UPI00165B96B6|nr:immunoglobulin superfamily member 11 isoform X5 [Fundulus heteroclitus]